MEVTISCGMDWFTRFLALPIFTNVVARLQYYLVNLLVENTIIFFLLFYFKTSKGSICTDDRDSRLSISLQDHRT